MCYDTGKEVTGVAGRRELSALVRAAVERYDMIAEGDRIAVGVSGGKDSMALLALLAELRRYYPRRFSLTAITLDPGFEGETDYRAIAALCEQWEIPYVLRHTHLWDVVREKQTGQTPCSLCARLRRGALHRTAAELGCGTVALGHHQDDAAETVLMNLLSGATLDCFSPKSYLDRSKITLIRPLVFAQEHEIAAYVRREQLPIVPSRCPVDGDTHRQRTKELIASLSQDYGDVSEKIVTALQKAGIGGWRSIEKSDGRE